MDQTQVLQLRIIFFIQVPVASQEVSGIYIWARVSILSDSTGFFNRFWNCSDDVVFFVFYFNITSSKQLKVSSLFFVMYYIYMMYMCPIVIIIASAKSSRQTCRWTISPRSYHPSSVSLFTKLIG